MKVELLFFEKSLHWHPSRFLQNCYGTFPQHALNLRVFFELPAPTSNKIQFHLKFSVICHPESSLWFALPWELVSLRVRWADGLWATELRNFELLKVRGIVLASKRERRPGKIKTEAVDEIRRMCEWGRKKRTDAHRWMFVWRWCSPSPERRCEHKGHSRIS